ncbi:hypothetical protein [Yersinia pseudotuberculosis]|uniref:hypothetical protein n=1 Tax=Yersinia pseudotuberculosis TaxID=633 RepID=UPI0005DEF64A|nr:hypothetical protein [Yersinia pseudotuberculosis]CNM03556.1 Uncharacterised protein [Yersinia pseudotuberculosis]
MIEEIPKGQKRGQLLKFEKEIFELRNNGFSYRQIVEFLKNKGCKTSIPTVQRFVAGKTKTI